MLFGALIAGTLCLGGPTAALAAQPEAAQPQAATASAQPQQTPGYKATIVVVSETGAESIVVTQSELTVDSALTSRGYDLTTLKDDKGNPLELGRKLQSGEQAVVYSSTVSGSSETIELKLPETRTEDPNLYEGEIIVASEGKSGSALKTTVVHRDLSKISQGPDTLPQSLDAAALSSETTQTGEEVYLTVLEAPQAKVYTVGTKACDQDLKFCELLKAGKIANLQVDGDWVHPMGPLGESMGWTTYGGQSRGHDGGAVDFPLPINSPIYSVADGTVAMAGIYPNYGAAGNMVVIRHADGTFTGYAHMVELPPVKVGDTVKAGQIIGLEGSTGRSTGPHLHFEAWSDAPWSKIIPSYEYMKERGIYIGDCTDGPCGLSIKTG